MANTRRKAIFGAKRRVVNMIGKWRYFIRNPVKQQKEENLNNN
jgi:hypothetical protein